MEPIERREAKSGNVSYSDPVILYESLKRRVVMVPFFITRSDHTELAIKITSYRKEDPPKDWIVIEEKSISLQEPAARKLLSSLHSHLAVSQEESDGSYLVIRVTDRTANLGKHDPLEVANALTSLLSKKEIVEHLVDVDFNTEFLTAFKGAIRLKEMLSAVTKLREYLCNNETSEQIFQQWCEDHSWAFGNAYVMHDEVRNISAGDKIDLLLPTVISGYRDIVELKRPDMSVIHYDEAHNNYYFASDVSKAIGQCHRYLEVFHEVAAHGLRDHPEIVAYYPRAIIVIGRSNSWNNEQLRGLHGLNQRLVGITVITYDQLLAHGERLISILSEQRTLNETDIEIDDNIIDWEDDCEVPF